MSTIKKLSELKVGTIATIRQLIETKEKEGLVDRLTSMGMVPGTRLEVLFEAPFGGGICVRLRNTQIGLRTADAQFVEVELCQM
ncbi:MAG: ferrous iron transport protein A [Bacteriovoracia bacterium]